MTYMERTAKAEKLMKITAQIKKLQDIESALKKEFQDEMLATGETVIDAGNLLIKWTPYMENRFDTTAFRKEHERMYKKYVKENERRRFTIVENTQSGQQEKPAKKTAKKATSVA